MMRIRSKIFAAFLVGIIFLAGVNIYTNFYVKNLSTQVIEDNQVKSAAEEIMVLSSDLKNILSYSLANPQKLSEIKNEYGSSVERFVKSLGVLQADGRRMDLTEKIRQSLENLNRHANKVFAAAEKRNADEAEYATVLSGLESDIGGLKQKTVGNSRQTFLVSEVEAADLEYNHCHDNMGTAAIWQKSISDLEDNLKVSNHSDLLSLISDYKAKSDEAVKLRDDMALAAASQAYCNAILGNSVLDIDVYSSKVTKLAQFRIANIALSSSQHNVTSFGGVALAFVIAILAAFFVSKNILSSVERLTTAAEKIVAGDFSQRVTMPDNDEIGHLGKVFNQMINALTQSQNSLNSTEKELKVLLDYVPLCVKWFDADGQLAFINKHGREEHFLTGKSEEEIKKWNFLDCIDIESKERVKAAVKEALAGRTVSLEVRHAPGSSTGAWCESTFLLAKDSSGAKRLLVLSQDIDERKRHEMEKSESLKKVKDSKIALLNILEDVRESEGKLQEERDLSRAILRSMGEGLFVVDKDFKILEMNAKAAELLGVKVEDLIGANYRTAIQIYKGEEKLHGLNRPIYNVLKTGTSFYVGLEDNCYYFCPISNRRFPVEVMATPMEQKKDSAAVVIFQDISKLKALDEAKSSFISVASHQLRTPLTSIRWYAEMLESGDVGKLNPDQKDFIDRIYGGALKLGETINLLLSLARIESGKTKLELGPVVLCELAEEVVRDLEPSIKQKNLTVSVACARDLSVMTLDRAMLREVIMNLLSNSIRYTDKDGKIELVFVKNDSDVTVSVKDDGIGVPAEEQGKIFGRFFRAGNAVSKVPDGSGLGLSLVKSLVDLWKGKVWFESPAVWQEGKKKVKKGTIFYITIPLK